jgi:hypothetical protein
MGSGFAPYTVPTMALNATCNGSYPGAYGMWALMAMAPTGGPLPRTCTFTVKFYRIATPNPGFKSCSCQILSSEGLPVELMEFSVEPAGDSDTSGTSDAEGDSSRNADS